MPFRPLSRRGVPDPLYDEPQEGIPDYMLEPVVDWIADVVAPSGYPSKLVIQHVQMALRMDPALDWRNQEFSAFEDLVRRVRDDREFGLDLSDFLLHLRSAGGKGHVLEDILITGGSAWEVTRLDGLDSQLTRRAIGPVRESIDAIRTVSERAHHHLTTAWSRLAGRDPDPSTAYREAVRALEAVARPVVCPNNDRATFGTMIRDLRAKPEKWDYVLEGANASDVAEMAGTIWTGQLDRHGTDDESVPLTVSQEQADAAFHVALALTRIFGGGLIRPI